MLESHTHRLIITLEQRRRLYLRYQKLIFIQCTQIKTEQKGPVMVTIAQDLFYFHGILEGILHLH